VVQGANTYIFAYNGLGDRMRQVVGGITTTYTLDLNAPLTQVLADGTSTYLYGPTRIGEQQPGGFAYHLPDALGSVRQLANTNANVTLTQSYEPFGSMMSKTGSGSTSFGWAGEATDASGLIFLRARYYSPTTGRFFVRDAWMGNTQMPGTLHPYLYGMNNPMLYTDPSGRCLFLGGADTVFCGAVIGAVVGGVSGAAAAYAGQVAGNLLQGKGLSEALVPTDRNAIFAAGIGGAVQGGICGGVAVATAGAGLTVGCGGFGGAAGGAATELAYTLLNGGSITDRNTWIRTGFAGLQGGAVGLATFGLANRFPALRTFPGQAAFGTTLSVGIQVAGNVFDDDPTTKWDYELGRAAVSGFANIVVSRLSFGVARAICSSGQASNLGQTRGASPDLNNLDQHAINSMIKRGWTKQQITEAYQEGHARPAIDKTAGGAPATRYVHPETGKSVVINDQTGKVIHLGGEGFKYDDPKP
jgi:RHS repeat-associated protein